MEIQILKQEYKDAIRSDVHMKAEIASVNEVSTWTVDRWRGDNNVMLTTATVLAIIRRRLKLDEKVELTEKIIIPQEKENAMEHV